MGEVQGPQYIALWKHRLEKVANLFKKYSKPNQKFLDIGCGDGSATLFLVKGLFMEVYGVDASWEFVEKAKNFFSCKLCDVGNESLPYSNDFFDIVHAGEIIEHVMNTDHLIKEISRVLKKDGILIISTPNLASWVNRILLALGFQPFDVEVSQRFCVGLPSTKKKEWIPVGHVRAFTLRALKELLVLNGFEVIEIHGTSSVVPFISARCIDHVCNFFFPSLSRTLILITKNTAKR